MELTIIFAILGTIAFFVGVYQVATHYKKDSGDPHERIRRLSAEKYSPDMNRWAAENETKAGQARSGTAIVIAGEMAVVTTMINRETDAMIAQFNQDMTPARMQRFEEKDKAVHRNEVKRINEATKRRISPPALDSIRAKEEEARVEMEKHRGMKAIDVDAAFQETMNTLVLCN